MKRKMIIDPTYDKQQQVLDEIAAKLGIVCFRPDYHGEDGDKNTVLFYTPEDDAYNCELDKSGDVPSEQYRRPFWTFENTDANGAESFDFANCGKLDLRPLRWNEVLEGSILFALMKAWEHGHIVCSGGILGLREADDSYNDCNRKQIVAFKLLHGSAYLGNVNFYGDRRDRIIAGKESIYEEYIGQFLYNARFSFCVPTADVELEGLIRKWNASDSPSEPFGKFSKISDRIKAIGGINFIWL